MNLKLLKILFTMLTLLLLLVGCQNKDNNIKTESTSDYQSSDKKNPKENENFTEPNIIEIDLSKYFGEVNGSAVFYSPKNNAYKIYNLNAVQEQRSPCSTFKIASTLAGLESGVITLDDSLRKWNGETFWKKDWNKDMSLSNAFQTSCVWYYREIINDIGPEKMQNFLTELKYGNTDISDWEGKLNKNNNNRALTGFWIESSLKISPLEQVKMLERIFGNTSPYKPKNVQLLKEIMKINQNETPLTIYGKTGYGKLKNTSLDSWFVGMFESEEGLKYFALHLSETDNPNVTSALAKSMAIEIISDKFDK